MYKGHTVIHDIWLSLIIKRSTTDDDVWCGHSYCLRTSLWKLYRRRVLLSCILWAFWRDFGWWMKWYWMTFVIQIDVDDLPTIGIRDICQLCNGLSINQSIVNQCIIDTSQVTPFLGRSPSKNPPMGVSRRVSHQLYNSHQVNSDWIWNGFDPVCLDISHFRISSFDASARTSGNFYHRDLKWPAHRTSWKLTLAHSYWSHFHEDDVLVSEQRVIARILT